MSMSDYLEEKLLNASLRNTAYTPPTTVYVALYKSDPSDDNTGTEVTGGDYARQTVTFSAPSSGAVASSNDVTFPTATADWGTATHFGLLDTTTAGNLLFSGSLTTPRTINSGDQFTFLAGQITVSLD